MIFPHSDPRVELILWLWLLAYSMIGAIHWETLRDAPKAQEWGWFLGVFGGPCVWAFLLVQGVARLRRRILARWELENHTCCGHDCRHP